MNNEQRFTTFERLPYFFDLRKVDGEIDRIGSTRSPGAQEEVGVTNQLGIRGAWTIAIAFALDQLGTVHEEGKTMEKL
jgi:hypothetical protein